MPSPRLTAFRAWLITAAVVLAITGAAGADEPAIDPTSLSSFTRAIQPLLLNHCATGACHGGDTAAAPQLRRGPVGGLANRTTTLANLQSITKAVADAGGSQAFLHKVLTGHEPNPSPRRGTPLSLSDHERQLLQTWLALSLPDTGSHTTAAGQASMTTAATPVGFDAPLTTPTPPRAAALPLAPSPRKPNRFRSMLERAANPLQLPPPRVTKGLDLEKVLPETFPPLPEDTGLASPAQQN
ncbi:MAG: hypothetical protein EBU59_08030 [Planctomycetia bacterium]|nr:hypothetical protein [Planctomycetia bacterium]